VVLAGLIILAVVNYARPLPVPQVTLELPTLPLANAVTPQWPTSGQAAYGAVGYGVLSTHNIATPAATASIAKVITALCVLQKYPLAVGQTGPTLTISDADVAIYNAYVAQNGSLLPVFSGEKLTEYQALQALMIPSANNIADTLVLWAFGSQSAYVAYANPYLKNSGLTQTRIGTDASGLDPGSTSTASDLTSLGLIAMRNPVLMEIAAQKSAELPGVGVVNNYDTILGENGITGLKTGNSDDDPGAFLFTASLPVGTSKIGVSGAVMSAPSLDAALQSSSTLVGSLKNAFVEDTLLRPNQKLGTIQTAWGSSIPVVADKQIKLVRYKSTKIVQHPVVHPVRLGAQTDIGDIEYTAGPIVTSATLHMQRAIDAPSFWWRLTRH
jgi:D-alanyl-D-alanine carboxypeptidase (penicillin-binding protein 5/6)